MTEAGSGKRRAVFLDRDGTLNVDFGYVGDPERVVIVPGAVEGAAMLTAAGFLLIVASNQSGIARGYFTQVDCDAVAAKVKAMFAAEGVELAAFYQCPHLPDAAVAQLAVSCDCRKPKPGMLVRAAKEWNVDLARSWTVGDRARDIAAGHAVGCRGVAIQPVPSLQQPEDFRRARPEYVARDLVDAARFIIERP